MISTLSTFLWFASAVMPSIGQQAPDFELDSIAGNRVRLSSLHAQAPVVLVVLRGFPGYQCPLCQRQVAEFSAKAHSFTEAGAKVVFVYPGPRERGAEFLTGKHFPASFQMLLDPSYEFTNLYGLRWDAPKETAYPSAFLIRQGGQIYFIKSVISHGGRASAQELLDMLPKNK